MSPIPTVTIDYKVVAGDSYMFFARTLGPKSYLSVASGGTFLLPADFGFNKLDACQLTGTLGNTAGVASATYDYKTGALKILTDVEAEVADAVDCSGLTLFFIGRARE